MEAWHWLQRAVFGELCADSIYLGCLIAVFVDYLDLKSKLAELIWMNLFLTIGAAILLAINFTLHAGGFW